MNVFNILTSLWSEFKSFSTPKKVLVVAPIIIVILFFSRSNKRPPTYETEPATLGSVSQVVSETGEIMSTGKTDVRSTITGIVTEVYVENGDQVEKDQKLFKVVSSATKDERATAYASYLSAKNTLDTAKRNKNTIESDMWQAHETFEEDALDTELSVDDPIYIQTERDWLAAEEKYLDQDEVIAQAQALVNSAWLAYQATIDGDVMAPISGTVANLSVAPGHQVNASDTALVVSASAEAWIKLSMSESDVVQVERGQTGAVSVDALDHEAVEAEVVRVDDFGTESSGIVTYNAFLTSVNLPDGAKPGMTVQVDITTLTEDDALLVPNAAVRPYQGGKAVRILNTSGQPIFVPIRIGIDGETYTQVLDGVELDQEVIVGESEDTDKKGKNFDILPAPNE